MPDNKTKLDQLAKIMDGQVITDRTNIDVCVKGILAGFPVTLEAIKTGYPFGVNYFLDNSKFCSEQAKLESFKLVIVPKSMPGWFSFIPRILLFESHGQRVGQPLLDKAFRFKYDNAIQTKKFAHYPQVSETILSLEKLSRFNEMLIQSSAGIYLSQPVPFVELDLDLCQKIFNLMAKLAQVIFEAF